jgi:hypothetical protein
MDELHSSTRILAILGLVDEQDFISQKPAGEFPRSLFKRPQNLLVL